MRLDQRRVDRDGVGDITPAVKSARAHAQIFQVARCRAQQMIGLGQRLVELALQQIRRGKTIARVGERGHDLDRAAQRLFRLGRTCPSSRRAGRADPAPRDRRDRCRDIGRARMPPRQDRPAPSTPARRATAAASAVPPDSAGTPWPRPCDRPWPTAWRRGGASPCAVSSGTAWAEAVRCYACGHDPRPRFAPRDMPLRGETRSLRDHDGPNATGLPALRPTAPHCSSRTGSGEADPRLDVRATTHARSRPRRSP